MAGVEPASAEAVAMFQGDRAENFRLVPSHLGPYKLGSNSSFAATRRMQHRKRFLRHSIVREPVLQPGREPRISILSSPAPEPHPMDQSKLRFLFEKQLRKSDVSSAGRIVIPKIEAEMYLPFLDRKEILSIDLGDMDYQQVWNFNFRAWANNRSRMYIFDNTKNFIKEHKLVVGDSIMVFKDYEIGNYLIRAIKNGVPEVPRHITDQRNNVNANLPIVDEYGLPLHYGTTNMNDYSMAYYSGMQQDHNPQFEPSALLWNHQLFNATNGTQLQVPYHTTNNTVANLPTMNEYGSPLFYGTTNMNDYSVACFSEVNPDNQQLEPSASFDWQDFADLLG